MPREVLDDLAADLRRLLAAGAAEGDAGLRRRASGLRELSRRVPALAAVAAAAERVASGGGAPALLDLAVVMGRVRAGLASAGVDGDLRSAEKAGPWRTPLAVPLLHAVHDGLTKRAPWRDGEGAAGDGLAADLRLLDPLLDAIDRRPAFAGEQALPAFGAALVPEARRRWNVAGKSRDVRLLDLLCRVDPHAAELCTRAIREGSTPVRLAAVARLPEVAPPEVAIPVLVAACGDAGEKVRRAAALALGKVGAAAVPALVAAVRSPEARRRAGAAAALGAVGAAAAEAVPALAEASRDDRSPVRAAAARALGEVGPAARGAVPRLCEVVATDQDPIACAAAINALRDLGAEPGVAVPAICTALQGATGTRAVAAFAGIRALWDLGPEAEPAVPLLCRFMDEATGWMRTNAALTLGQIGPAAAVAVPLLVRELSDPSPTHRELAARSLKGIGPAARAAAPALEAALQDREPEVRWEAALALVSVAPPRRPAADSALLRVLWEGVQDNRYRRTRGEALAALRRLDPSGKTALRVIAEVLRDPQTREPGDVGSCLGRLGLPTEVVAPAVVEMIQRALPHDPFLVSQFGPDPRIVAALVRHLASPAGAADESLACRPVRAARALGDFGAAARAAVPALTALVQGSQFERFDAAVALARITGDVRPALALTAPALRAPGIERRWAARAVGFLGAAAAPLVPELIALLRDTDEVIQLAAIDALGRVGPPALAAAPHLVAVLQSPVGWLPRAAACALLGIGAAVPAALAADPVRLWADESAGSSYAEARTARTELEQLGANPSAVRTLTAALGHEDAGTRLRAALTLASLDTELTACVPALADAASVDPDDGLVDLRVRAVELLGSMGPIARSAVAQLVAALPQLRNWELRKAVRQAADRLGR
jgi:HEAT repeat protein